jgi:hypothetical protein
MSCSSKDKQNFPLQYFTGNKDTNTDTDVVTLIALLLITVMKNSLPDRGVFQLGEFIAKHLFSYVKLCGLFFQQCRFLC